MVAAVIEPLYIYFYLYLYEDNSVTIIINLKYNFGPNFESNKMKIF